MKKDYLFSVQFNPVFVLGISFQNTSSWSDSPRQWRSYYIGFLFWEFSLTVAWSKKEQHEMPRM
jgi:hypothetical protein